MNQAFAQTAQPTWGNLWIPTLPTEPPLTRGLWTLKTGEWATVFAFIQQAGDLLGQTHKEINGTVVLGC